MNYPRLFNADGSINKILHPISVSIIQNIVPLSYASVKLSVDEQLPIRGLVELFTPYGSAGVFRVRTPNNTYGNDISSAELEHSIAEIGDYLVKEKIDSMEKPQKIVSNIFTKYYKGSLWKLGKTTGLGTKDVAVSVNYNRILDTLLSILEQIPDCMMTFDFSKRPYIVNFVKKGTTVEAEGRLSRNITSAKISYDDTELCTRVYYETFSKDKNGNIVSKWNYKNASKSIQTQYGIVEREVSTSSDMTSAEITFVVDNYLAQHQQPKVSVSIDGLELSAITGESLDKFIVGKLFRLAIPEYNIVLEDYITSVSWENIYDNQKTVTIRIGDEMDTVVTFLHNLDSTGAGGGGGGGGRKKEEDKWKEYETHFTQTDYMIDMNATRVDRANKILEKAGLNINSKGVLIYAEDRNDKNLISSKLNVLSTKITSEVKNAKAGLMSTIEQTASSIKQTVRNTETKLKSEIKQEADRISLVVEGTGANAKIKPASIVAGINSQTGSYVKISANTINLSGYVTMSAFNATDAKIDNLMSGNTTATKILTNRIDSGNVNVLSEGTLSVPSGATFKWHGYTISSKTIIISGTTYHLLGY